MTSKISSFGLFSIATWIWSFSKNFQTNSLEYIKILTKNIYLSCRSVRRGNLKLGNKNSIDKTYKSFSRVGSKTITRFDKLVKILSCKKSEISRKQNVPFTKFSTLHGCSVRSFDACCLDFPSWSNLSVWIDTKSKNSMFFDHRIDRRYKKNQYNCPNYVKKISCQNYDMLLEFQNYVHLAPDTDMMESLFQH